MTATRMWRHTFPIPATNVLRLTRDVVERLGACSISLFPESVLPRQSDPADFYACFPDLTGCRKTISARQNFDGLHVWAKWRTLPQDAQKGCPARPQRVKTRGGTYRTSCGPFALAMGLGERKIPYSASDLREDLLSVEGLNDARTPLADFFSILLKHTTFCPYLP